VKNITSNSSLANSVYANPLDHVMFLITIQSNGDNDANNVYVRDTLPYNLIYKGNMIVAGTSNYSGNIVSGMTFNRIREGDIITITYQAQVASAGNFSYGTTTLTSNTSINSSNLNYNPSASASVMVTRSAVYGASSISTGLTNNFWVDSFFLPLMIALIGLWMWRSGIFFGLERWLDRKKKNHKSYSSEKELNKRIEMIRKMEGV